MKYFYKCSNLSEIRFLLELGVKNISISYPIKKLPDLQEIRAKFPDIENIFLTNSRKAEKTNYVEYLSSFEQYYTFVTIFNTWQDDENFDNWLDCLEMESLKILPVYVGTNRSYLKQYCQQTNYVALTGNDRRRIFLEYPRIRFHDLAGTSYKELYKHPYYSADSAMWSRSTAFGFKLNSQLRAWGLQHGIGASDLIDTKLNKNLRNFKNRRKVFVLGMQHELEKVNHKFRNWKFEKVI